MRERPFLSSASGFWENSRPISRERQRDTKPATQPLAVCVRNNNMGCMCLVSSPCARSPLAQQFLGHADNEQCNPRYARPCGRHAQTLQYTRHKLLFICPPSACHAQERAIEVEEFNLAFSAHRETDGCAAVEGEKQHLLDLRVTKFHFNSSPVHAWALECSWCHERSVLLMRERENAETSRAFLFLQLLTVFSKPYHEIFSPNLRKNFTLLHL